MLQWKKKAWWGHTCFIINWPPLRESSISQAPSYFWQISFLPVLQFFHSLKITVVSFFFFKTESHEPFLYGIVHTIAEYDDVSDWKDMTTVSFAWTSTNSAESTSGPTSVFIF